MWKIYVLHNYNNAENLVTNCRKNCPINNQVTCNFFSFQMDLLIFQNFYEFSQPYKLRGASPENGVFRSLISSVD